MYFIRKKHEKFGFIAFYRIVCLRIKTNVSEMLAYETFFSKVTAYIILLLKRHSKHNM